MQLCRADCVSARRERRHSPIRHPPRHRPGLGPPDLTTGRCGGVILEETADFLTLGNEVDWTVRRKRGGPGWRRPSLRHQWFFPRRLRSQNRGGSVPLPVPLLWSSVTAPPHRQAEPRSHRMAHLSLCTDFLPTARGPPRPQRRATSAFLKAQGPLSPGRRPDPCGRSCCSPGPGPRRPAPPPTCPVLPRLRGGLLAYPRSRWGAATGLGSLCTSRKPRMGSSVETALAQQLSLRNATANAARRSSSTIPG